jgi:flagellar basal-body rod protein FlgF
MQNATYVALSRLIAQERAMDVIAGNVANASTPAYKAERVLFSDWLSRQTGARVPPGGDVIAFTQDRATWREHQDGTLQHTGNPLDLAIGADGYFTVSTPQGPRLTRAGRFSLTANGTISDEAGNPLLDVNGRPIRVTMTDTNLQIAGDGTISSENGQIARIGVVVPSDPNRITAEGNSLFRADVPTRPVAAPRITQGAIEQSNVQPVLEMTRMMDAMREFQFVTQFVQAESDRQQSAIDKILQPQS